MTKWVIRSGLAISMGLALLTACKAKPEPEAKPAIQAAEGAAATGAAGAEKTGAPAGPAWEADSPGRGLRAGIGRYCDAMSLLSHGFADKAYVREESGRATLPCDSTRPGADSIMKQWLALQDSADRLIQAYSEELASGVGDPSHRPALLEARWVTDSLSLARLPKVPPSSFLNENSFFFLGAGPFLDRVLPEEGDPETHRDLQGRPELRFCNEFSRNTGRIMDMIRGFAQAPATTQDGPPIPLGHSEAIWLLDKSVKGTGSLLHVMSREIPAYFITAEGLVTARLAEVTDRLFESEVGCTSESPKVCFGVPTLPEREILGIFIPYEPLPLTHCKVTRKRQVWTVDLTGDDVPELAAVTSSREGLHDTLHKVVWYGNVSGVWVPLDAGEDPECT